MAEELEGTPRRSFRVRKPTPKALENAYVKNLAKSGFVGNISSSESSSEDEELLQMQEEFGTGSPSVLQSNDHVQGDKIFQFQKRVMKNRLLQKIKESHENSQKTPQAQRSKLKKAVYHELNEDDSEQEPFTESESDYIPSENSSAANSENDDSSGSQKSHISHDSAPKKSKSSTFPKTINKMKNLKIDKKSKTDDDLSQTSSTDSEDSASSASENSNSSNNSIPKNQSKQSKRAKKTTQIKNLKIENKPGVKTRSSKRYTIKTDDYFQNQGTQKVVTSNHTLDKLETPRLAQHQLQSLLKNMTVSENHQRCIDKLYKQNLSMYTKWLYVLHENFNILVYGLGSKRNILTQFHNEFLNNSPVIVVNGFFPSLSIKDILDGIIEDLLELKRNPVNVFECCDVIEEEFKQLCDIHLYLIVHNIDGEMLRNSKAQSVLARLAAIENIHLVASLDHINGPLMWDHAKLSKFNYTWWDMTSFLPYIGETSFESSMMIQKSGEFALSSLRNVFLSLTTNSKGIYLLIVKYQLDNSKNQFYQGMAFKDLYSSCRESFLVSSDLALRAQLTEFVDHKMVKFRRSLDGVEHLVISIPNALLQKFLDEQNN